MINEKDPIKILMLDEMLTLTKKRKTEKEKAREELKEESEVMVPTEARKESTPEREAPPKEFLNIQFTQGDSRPI